MLRKRSHQSQSCSKNTDARFVQLDVQNVREQAVSEEVEEESAESGQESEDTGSSLKPLASNSLHINSSRDGADPRKYVLFCINRPFSHCNLQFLSMSGSFP